MDKIFYFPGHFTGDKIAAAGYNGKISYFL